MVTRLLQNGADKTAIRLCWPRTRTMRLTVSNDVRDEIVRLLLGR